MSELKQYAQQVDELLPEVAVKLIRFLKDMPDCDITIAQAFLMHRLKSRGKCTASEIGEMMAITSGPVTSITQRLIKRGLVKRWTDEEDRRIGWFALTPEGEAMVAAFSEYSQNKWAMVLEQLGPERARNVIGLLEGTIRILSTLHES